MFKIIKIVIFILSLSQISLAGGISGGGPPGSMADCYANAIKVDPLLETSSYTFSNNIIFAGEFGLISKMPPKTFADFKDLLSSSLDFSSSFDLDSESFLVRDIYILEAPETVEMVLENDQIISISPSEAEPAILCP